ncbi:MAG: hypothetical protein OJF51_004454 [Nitrospira sp.]|nr:MAG: hypothetical protein OJF51_004454 [Nitrospira sp.]
MNSPRGSVDLKRLHHHLPLIQIPNRNSFVMDQGLMCADTGIA